MTEIARIVHHQAEVGRGLGVIDKTATLTGIREFEILRFAKTMQVDLIV